MANLLETKTLKLVMERWNLAMAQFARLNMPRVLPGDAHAIFSIVNYPKTPDEIGIEVKPVVFNLPERANGSPNLFVVVEGRISFDESAIQNDKSLRTMGFNTRAAYFRKKADELEHVYGAHYDFAPDEIGHPAFHAQMRSYLGHNQWVVKYFEMTECTSNDRVDRLLRNVRLPTAQMDFFSFVLQLCADHLLSKDSGEEERAAFGSLKTASASIRGAAFRVPRLANPATQECLRANHWYP
jgi:hypothetical protein